MHSDYNWYNVFMPKQIYEIKKEMELKLAELHLKRKNIITQFKKRIEKVKIDQIKNSILNK